MPQKWQLWMPLHIDRFFGSPAVQAMPPAAQMGYLSLLTRGQWQSDDGTISSDPLDLAETSGLGDELWALHGPRILRNFVPVNGNGRLRNLVNFEEWEEAKRIFDKNHPLTAEELSAKRSAAGRIGNEIKWPEIEDSGERGRNLRSERMAAARSKGTHTAQEWIAMVEFCGGKCLRCGEILRLVKNHIRPVYQGGSDGIENLQPLCAHCNCSKGPENKDYRPANWLDCLANASQTPRMASPTTVVPVSVNVPISVSVPVDLDSGSEFMLGANLMEELGIVGGPSELKIIADALRHLAKEGGTMLDAHGYIMQAGKAARSAGEVIDRFWFTGQRYRPQVPRKTPRELAKEAKRKAFMEAPID